MARPLPKFLAWPLARLRPWLQAIGRTAEYIADAIACGVAMLRSPWQTTWQIPARTPEFKGKLAIFAHHDPLNRVGAYVLAHLAALRAQGFRILFVSNAGEIEEKSLKELRPLCDALLVRKNWGGKWGAWREALRYLGDNANLSMLLLIDDSRYGPLTPLEPLLAKLDFTKADIWSLTDSWQTRWHLQSYFLAINPTIMGTKAWAKFWSGVLPLRSARWLFRHGEIGFSQTMIKAGLRMQPIFTKEELCDLVDRTPLEEGEPDGLRPRFRYVQLQKIDAFIASHKPFDVTQQLWRQLLQIGCPYFSRQLLRSNPDLVQDLFDWVDMLEDIPTCDITLIEKDLTANLKERRRAWTSWFTPLIDGYFLLRKAAKRGRELFSITMSLPRSPLQARYVWPETPVQCGERVVVFVHFDKKGEVRPYVLEYLRALRAAETSILFVSNSGKLQPEAIESLKPLCMGIIVRRNRGYDFGAWREGLAYLKGSLDQLHWLAIVNDSVYGPLTPLGPLLARMDFSHIDVWGMTDSEQRNYHMQSYFIAFSRRVLRSQAWRDFWRSVRPATSKSWAISNGELKITGVLQKAGFKCAALYPYQDLLKLHDPINRIANRGATPYIRLRLRQRHSVTHAMEQGYKLNPTADLWRQLLRAGYPFLKRELLRSNPSGVPDTLDWKAEIANTSGADVQLIEEDLRKSVIGRMA